MRRNAIKAFVLLFLITPAIGIADAQSLPSWIERHHLKWSPPPGGVVKDGKTAIIIAHAIWTSAYPERAKQIGTEANWESGMTATLSHDVWEVASRGDPHSVGGGLFIYVNKSDGRVLGIFLTQ
jgi:hypothetical protein